MKKNQRGAAQFPWINQWWTMALMKIPARAEKIMDTPDVNSKFEEERTIAARVDKVLLEPLAVKFRRLTREILLNEEIQKLLKRRIELELDGHFDGKTPVLTAMIRVAAGPMNPAHGGASRGSDATSWQGPLVNLHFEHLTDEQLEMFVNKGIRPTVKNVTPAKQLPEHKETKG